MSEPSTTDRATPVFDLAAIFDNETVLVEGACSRFFRDHPEYSEATRRICREDMIQNLRYLACAVASKRFELFRDYLLWLREIFEKRSIPVAHLSESLQLLQQELEDSLEPPQPAAYRSFLEQGITLLNTSWAEIPPAGGDSGLDPPAQRYLDHILTGDRRAAETHVLDSLVRGRSYADVVTDIIQPALAAVGRAWQENDISVAREHLSTAITHGILARCLMEIEPGPSQPSAAVFACVQGNRHSLGLLTVSDAFDLAGWRTHYLGADTPVADLVDFIQLAEPALVGLSISLPQHVLMVKHIVDGIRKTRPGSGPTILAGGHMAEQLSPLLLAYGVDAVFGNVRDCLRYAVP